MQDVAGVLDRLAARATSRQRATVVDLSQCLGRDAFSPALLTAGLLALSPLGDVPGASGRLGGGVVTLTAQMRLGRRTLWLADFVLRRAFDARRLHRTTRVLRPVVRLPGAVVRRRLVWATVGAFERAIAAICLVLALTLPPLEVVPFGATVPSSVITALSIAHVARDGLIALLSMALLIGGGRFVATLAG